MNPSDALRAFHAFDNDNQLTANDVLSPEEIAHFAEAAAKKAA